MNRYEKFQQILGGRKEVPLHFEGHCIGYPFKYGLDIYIGPSIQCKVFSYVARCIFHSNKVNRHL